MWVWEEGGGALSRYKMLVQQFSKGTMMMIQESTLPHCKLNKWKGLNKEADEKFLA